MITRGLSHQGLNYGDRNDQLRNKTVLLNLKFLVQLKLSFAGQQEKFPRSRLQVTKGHKSLTISLLLLLLLLLLLIMIIIILLLLILLLLLP